MFGFGILEFWGFGCLGLGFLGFSGFGFLGLGCWGVGFRVLGFV